MVRNSDCKEVIMNLWVTLVLTPNLPCCIIGFVNLSGEKNDK
jgi:hypothetical protein